MECSRGLVAICIRLNSRKRLTHNEEKLRRKVGVINSRLVRRDAFLPREFRKKLTPWWKCLMSRPLCDVLRPRARVIDTLAVKKRFYVRLILHRSFFLPPRFTWRHYLHTVNDVLYYRGYYGNTGSFHAKLRAIDVADVTFPRECHSV